MKETEFIKDTLFFNAGDRRTRSESCSLAVDSCKEWAKRNDGEVNFT